VAFHLQFGTLQRQHARFPLTCTVKQGVRTFLFAG
jgi:hypothetical protein